MKQFVSGAACAIAIGLGGAMAGLPASAQEAQDANELSMPEYEALIADAMSYENPVAYDAAVSAILARDDLTDWMRGRTLFERATRRWKDGMNKFGAVEDFEAILAIDPNHAFANNASIERDYAQIEIGYIEDDMTELQTLSEWFEGAFALGLHDEAVGRYRKAGISPPPQQVELLQAFGYVCEDEPSAPKLHKFGPERPDLANMHWCGPAADMPGPDLAPRVVPVAASQTQTADTANGTNVAPETSENQPAIAVAGP